MLDADKYEVGSNKNAKELNAVAMRQAVGTGTQMHPDQIESRTAMRIPMGGKLSFGTYFNAFPASYWRRWTVVSDVELTVRVSGRGAIVTVYRSLANGRSQRVDSDAVEGSSAEFSLPAAVDAVRRRRLVLVRRHRGRRGRRRRVRRVDRRGPRRQGRPRLGDDRHHHDEPPGLLRQAAQRSSATTSGSRSTSTRCS